MSHRHPLDANVCRSGLNLDAVTEPAALAVPVEREVGNPDVGPRRDQQRPVRPVGRRDHRARARADQPRARAEPDLRESVDTRREPHPSTTDERMQRATQSRGRRRRQPRQTRCDPDNSGFTRPAPAKAVDGDDAQTMRAGFRSIADEVERVRLRRVGTDRAAVEIKRHRRDTRALRRRRRPQDRIRGDVTRARVTNVEDTHRRSSRGGCRGTEQDERNETHQSCRRQGLEAETRTIFSLSGGSSDACHCCTPLGSPIYRRIEPNTSSTRPSNWGGREPSDEACSRRKNR